MEPHDTCPASSGENTPVSIDERLATVHQQIVDTENVIARELNEVEHPSPSTRCRMWREVNACLMALERLRRGGFILPSSTPQACPSPNSNSTTEISDAAEDPGGFESGPIECRDERDELAGEQAESTDGTRGSRDEEKLPDPFTIRDHTSTDLDSQLRWGRFEIRGELGRGGQGIVFLAHDPHLNRDVALKIPRPEVVMTGPLRERFLREAQMAARLDHPHLVPVYEAGEIGPVCYLTTAYCPGMTLAHWLQVQKQPVDTHVAARLVAILADAVQYIHRHGVVHRDLKPGNIILQVDPNASDDSPSEVERGAAGSPSRGGDLPFIPRLTDFGLAKLDDGQPGTTRTGAVMGTLQYMAPEQVDGRSASASPRTDVYGLGAILYELLTGQPPFQRKATELETLRSVMRETPPVPRTLRSEIPSDLEAICLKAMSWELARRYDSAAAMADDLRRYLEGRPVVARPPTPWGRLGRWGRRNPVVASLTASLSVLLMAGFVSVTLLWQQATINLQLARSSQNRSAAMFQEAHRAVREFHHVLFTEEQYNAPEFQPIRKELLEKTLKYYQAFLEQQIDPAVLRADIADAHYQLASVHSTLGAKEEATRLFRDSLPWWRRLLQEQPDSNEYRYFLGKTLHALAWLAHGEGDLKASRALYAEALEIWNELVETNPDHAGYRVDLAMFLHNCGCLHASSDELERALHHLEEAKRVAKDVLAGDESQADARFQLASTYSKLGAIQVARKEFSQAANNLRLARERYTQSLENGDRITDSARGLADVLRRLGKLHRKQDDLARAHQYHQEAQVRLERLAADFPEVARIKQTLASNSQDLAKLHESLQEWSEAAQWYRQAWGLREELLKMDPSGEGARQDVVQICRKMGQFYLRTGSLEEAQDCLNRATELCQSVDDWREPWDDLHAKVISSRHTLARRYQKLGDVPKSHRQLELARRLLSQWRAAAPESDACLELQADWEGENDRLRKFKSFLSQRGIP